LSHQFKISQIFNTILFFLIIFFPQESSSNECENIVNKQENPIFIAKYDLKKNKITFGTNVNIYRRIQSDVFEVPKYSFQIFACTAGIFKLKRDDRKETSLFSIIKDKIRSDTYHFNRTLKDRIEKVNTIFQNKSVKGDGCYHTTQTFKNGEKNNLEHKDLNCGALDRLSVQIDYQKKLKSGIYDTEYFVVDKGRERNYIFELVDAEVINTIFGETETIIVKRTIQGNKRSTLTWYAINHEFVPVKIEQYRKKTLKFTAYLTKYKIN